MKEALGECELEGKWPEGNGLDLLLGKLTFEKDWDKEKCDAMLKRVIFMFMQDQACSVPAYMPPEPAKKRCIWLWGEKEVEESLGEVEVTSDGPINGKQLLLLEKLKDDDTDKVPCITEVHVGLMSWRVFGPSGLAPRF